MRTRRIVTDTVATLNMKATIDPDTAAKGLGKVLAKGVDAIGLQEWSRCRGRRVFPRFREYTFVRPLTSGGGPVGLRNDRYRIIRCRGVMLAPPGRVDKSPGRRRFLGASIATLVVAEDLLTGELVAFINYHLTAEVENDRIDRDHDGYRDDRPLRVARHKQERRRLERLISRQLAKGRTVYATGDGNLDEMRLRGVTSCWEGRRPIGTHGKRSIDDVHGPVRADEVTVVATVSDHDGVVTIRRRVVRVLPNRQEPR